MSRSPENIRLLRRASRFFLAHRGDSPEAKVQLGRSFGYFTHHPFARLNHHRLDCITAWTRRLLPKPGRVLEIGCGAGIITQALALQGHRALGVDPDAQEIRWAKRFAQEERLNAQFLTGDALSLAEIRTPIEDILGGKPDLLVFAYSLHHIPQVDKAVADLCTWLPPHAAILVNEENPETKLFRVKHRLRAWLQKDTETEWHRCYADWNTLLATQGFVPIGKPDSVLWSLTWGLKKGQVTA